MLEKRVEEWTRELQEEGRLLGLKDGFERGIQEGHQKGIEEGRQRGEASLLLRLLQRRFERLDEQTRKRVRSADATSLLAWGEQVLTAERLEDVFASYVASGRNDGGPVAPLLRGPENGPLRRADQGRDLRVPTRRQRTRKRIPKTISPEEFKLLLAERIDEWTRESREEGRRLGLKEGLKQGIQEGRQKGLPKGRQEGEAALLLRLLARKFGRLDPQVRKRVRSAAAKSLLEWGERVLAAARLEDVFAD